MQERVLIVQIDQNANQVRLEPSRTIWSPSSIMSPFKERLEKPECTVYNGEDILNFHIYKREFKVLYNHVNDGCFYKLRPILANLFVASMNWKSHSIFKTSKLLSTLVFVSLFTNASFQMRNLILDDPECIIIHMGAQKRFSEHQHFFLKFPNTATTKCHKCFQQIAQHSTSVHIPSYYVNAFGLSFFSLSVIICLGLT